MSRDTAASFFIESPSLGNSAELYQVLLRGIDNYQQVSNRFIQLAEQAHAFRQFNRVREYGQVLSNVPIKSYQAAGHYYIALANNSRGSGNLDKDRKQFELVIDSAPDLYKAKALLSLGAVSLRAGDYPSQVSYSVESAKASKDVSTTVRAHLGIAIYKSMEGFHQQALKDMENLYTLARYSQPVVFFDYLNSLAVELGEVGRMQEARHVARTVLASPFAFAYPEWRATAEELKAANRASVFIGASPDIARNVLFMPVEHEHRQSSSAWSPAPVLDFQKWKAKMRKKGDSKKSSKIATEKEMLVRLMEIFTDDETTDEQRRKIWEAAEEIITEPPTNTDKPAS
jgi:hypothetical protein